MLLLFFVQYPLLLRCGVLIYIFSLHFAFPYLINCNTKWCFWVVESTLIIGCCVVFIWMIYSNSLGGFAGRSLSLFVVYAKYPQVFSTWSCAGSAGWTFYSVFYFYMGWWVSTNPINGVTDSQWCLRLLFWMAFYFSMRSLRRFRFLSLI